MGNNWLITDTSTGLGRLMGGLPYDLPRLRLALDADAGQWSIHRVEVLRGELV